MTGCGKRTSIIHGIYYMLVVACLMICCGLNIGARTAGNRESPRPPLKEIRFAAVQGIYPNVSRKDGRLAIELLMQKIILKKAYPYSLRLFFIEPEEIIADAIQRGGYHFVTLSSIDYYKYRASIHLEPILIPSKIDLPAERLRFLVEKDQTLSSIAQKEERSLIIERGTLGDLSMIWLDTLLLDRGLPDSQRFFTSIRRVDKPTRAVLPVFFKQADACIVSRSALEVISELNPQIGRKVKSVYQSEELVRLMICATDKPSRKEIEIIIRESTHIEKNTETRQAMAILQMKRFLQFHPGDLAATEKLLLRHGKMTAPTMQ